MNNTAKDENELPLFPGLLPYGHTVGAPAFRPSERGVIISKSAEAMNEQVEMQKHQIAEQVELLKRQYLELEERRVISHMVYAADFRFKPEPGETHHLYQRENGELILSLIAPEQWNRSNLTYYASVKMLYDMTWEVVRKGEDFVNNFNNF
jgi:hypothetical protein